MINRRMQLRFKFMSFGDLKDYTKHSLFQSEVAFNAHNLEQLGGNHLEAKISCNHVSPQQNLNTAGARLIHVAKGRAAISVQPA